MPGAGAGLGPTPREARAARPPASGAPSPSPREPSPRGRPASCSSLFVCRGLHTHTELPFFSPGLFSSVPKFTPSVTSASAPPLLGTAFCLSGRLGSMGVCDDNNPRAYITRFILQALGRQSPIKRRARVGPGGCRGKQDRSGQAEARRPGGRRRGAEARPSWLPRREVRPDKNNDSGLREERGPAATFSRLRCGLRAPGVGSLEKLLKAARVSMMRLFFL